MCNLIHSTRYRYIAVGQQELYAAEVIPPLITLAAGVAACATRPQEEDFSSSRGDWDAGTESRLAAHITAARRWVCHPKLNLPLPYESPDKDKLLARG